jgi:AcrR family transcriptional regulator
MEKKQQLYAVAKEIFSEKGFKETNISAITKAAHVAVGTFYLYYSSKEQLFMEIFRDENAALKQVCLSALDTKQPPLVVIRQMLMLNQQGIAANPILREWYQSEEFRKIEKLFREEHAIDSLDFLHDAFLTLIERWQTEGVMRADIPSRKIMLMFAALINIDTHKDEIGMEHFPELLDLMTELLVNSLTV